MASYLIKKCEDKKKLVNKNNTDGYIFRSSLINNTVEIEKITIFNTEIINKILEKKIEKKFKRVAAIVYDIVANNDDDDTAADSAIALDEVAKLKEIILNKYQLFLKKELQKEYLKKLRLLEKEMKNKLMISSQYEEKIESNRKGR